MNIISKWHIATATDGNEISVQIIPLKRRQSTMDGFKWVEVGKKVLLQSGQEIEFNQDGKSFYTSVNQLYRLT